ncbi:NPP1 family protein [Saccharothrix sp. NRRL B-16348]|uniref:NPP1 family protein n=1 Tax=Saccharothrix sp. NRRL B-16348 TaxID=1415542 RepID=UPI001E349F53|nr:NPP1 family protein [Saccharothrix sp. NRRL B-16348]
MVVVTARMTYPSRTAPRAKRATVRLLGALVGAALLAVLVPGAAWADPPQALPANHTADDGKWQPAFDYDTDGCYPTPAISPSGAVATGLKNSGALNGQCRDQSDLDNTNSYSRSKCNNNWCAYLYDLYFEKDQAVAGWDCCGHRHDIEHVIVWVSGDQAQYVSTSAHGKYSTYPRSQVAWEGTHPKIVYHKDGLSTHCFRLAGAGEQPENHYGTWQYPDLVSWDRFPAGVRDILVNANFGSASLAIKDGAFAYNLAQAKPSGIPFDPNA